MNGFRPVLRLGRRAREDPWICPSCRAAAATRSKRRIHNSATASSEVTPVPTGISDVDPGILGAHMDRTGEELGQPAAELTHDPPIRITLRSLLRKTQRQTQIAQSDGDRRRASIIASLHAGRPAEIAAKLASASQDTALLQSIPGTTWTEIIRHLNPKTWVPPLPATHRSVNLEQLFRGTPLSPSTSTRAHVQTLAEIVRVRRGADVPMVLADYRLLLEYAGRMCSFRMAQSVWRDMNADGIMPDLDCYNALIEASLYDSGQRLRLLAHGQPNKDMGGEGHALWRSGASSAVEQVFERMKSDPSISPDTRTYCALITAFGRDNKLDELAAVLKDTWNLDVHAIASEEPKELTPYHHRGHRLYPNSRLLVVLADAYGPRNDISTAFRLIDVLSTTYSIPVNRQVWHQLLMWTWLFGRIQSSELRRRSRELRATHSSTSSRLSENEDYDGEEATDDGGGGGGGGENQPSIPSPLEDRERRRLLHSRFSALFAAMLSNPHSNLSPTMHMLHMSFTNTSVAGISPATAQPHAIEPALTGRRLLYELNALQRSARASADALLRSRRAPGRPVSPIAPAKAVQREQGAHMDTRIAVSYVQRWARGILERGVPASAVAHMKTEEAEALETWRLVGVPCFVREWKAFVPGFFRYQVPGGIVELVFRTSAEVDAKRRARALRDVKAREEEEEQQERERDGKVDESSRLRGRRYVGVLTALGTGTTKRSVKRARLSRRVAVKLRESRAAGKGGLVRYHVLKGDGEE